MHRISITLTTAFALTLGIGLWVAGCGSGTSGDAHEDHAAHAEATPAKTEAAKDTSMGHATADKAGAVRSFDARPPVGTKALCPVSGEAHVVTADTAVVEHGGRHYAFCCPSCQPRFEADPASFADAGAGG